jgi:curved DNA-binding protein CbpA
MNPYQVLGVAVDATEEQIRQAYHDLARVWHPDRFHSDRRLREMAQERLLEINRAYTILKGAERQTGEGRSFRRQDKFHQYPWANDEGRGA